jgi:hypothetical protein
MGGHVPGHTDRWEQFQRAGGAEAFADEVVDSAFGTPEELREHFRGFADAGVDQVILVQQGGNTRHEHICESLELFAEAVMPEFHDEEAERRARKREELRPAVEAAMERRDAPGASTRRPCRGSSLTSATSATSPTRCARPSFKLQRHPLGPWRYLRTTPTSSSIPSWSGG